MTAPDCQHFLLGDASLFQLYSVGGRIMVHCLTGECFREDCQAAGVIAGGGSIHVWELFHIGAKSTISPLNTHVIAVWYIDILWNTLLPFAKQHFQNNFRKHDDNATFRHSKIITTFLLQDYFIEMEQTVLLVAWTQPHRTPGPWFNIKMPSYQYRKSHCGDKTILRPSYLHNGISYTGKMATLYWIRAPNLSELRQTLLDKWTEVPAKLLQNPVASMPRVWRPSSEREIPDCVIRA